MTLLKYTYNFTSSLLHIVSVRPLYVHYKFNLHTTFLSFSPDQGTQRNRKLYSHNSPLKLAVNAENTADAPATRYPEISKEPINGILPDLIKEGIKENLERLKEQMSTLIQVLN